MGNTIDIREDALTAQIAELRTLASEGEIQAKITEIDGVLSQSCGNSVTELKNIHEELQTIHNSMKTLITTTADMLQAVLDSFISADEGAAGDIES